MPERIEVPPTLTGDTQNRITQIWRYLYSISEILNRNMQSIGGNELTDRERASMNRILQSTSGTGQAETESLKDLVVRTADYVQKALGNIEEGSLRDEVTSGRFGRYVSETKISVPMDPQGNTLAQQLSAILQGLKRDDIRMRGSIYTGVLRTEDDTDIYGTAIGRNVVTFAQDGTETYHPENAVMEIIGGEIRAVNQATLTGNLTGNVTGDVTGNLTGDVTGNVTGDVTGNVTGDLTGNVNGDVTGNVTGDLTGNVTGDVTGNLTGIVLPAETTETDFDDITGQGQYWIDMDSMTGGPADLITGIVLLEVLVTTGIVYQRISAEGAIYSRQYTAASWGSWVKYTGV